MKKLMVTIAVMAVVGGLYAQQNDTIVSTKADTVSPKQAMELQEVGISATKPVYMTDGEKTLYNVSEDPAIQTGTAADALQNTASQYLYLETQLRLIYLCRYHYCHNYQTKAHQAHPSTPPPTRPH